MLETTPLSPATGILGDVLLSNEISFYLYIVVFGLLVKLAVSYRELRHPTPSNRHLRSELLVFIGCFLLYSISQIFVFAPIAWSSSLGITRPLIVKTFYMLDGTCLIVSIYLMLSLLGYQMHKSMWVRGAALSYVLIGSYFLFATELFLSPVLPGQYSGVSGLGGGYGGPLVLLSRTVVFVCLIFVCYGIYRCYRAAQANELQIKSLYALLACFLYTSNCLFGLFKVLPMNIAVRGILFFVVVLILFSNNNLFDLRLSTPRTLENRTINRYRDIFLAYSNEKIHHREAMRAIEKLAVEYKLNKAKGFSPDLKSVISKAALSMGVNQNSIYNLLRKHDIELPNKKSK